MVEEITLGLLASDSVEDAPPDITTLVRQHSALLYRLANSILRNPPESEDVVQETYLRAIAQGKKLARVQDHRLWLMRVTWNLALDRKRRITPQQIDPLTAAGLAALTTPADTALDHARRIAAVLAAIDKLPRLERSALQLSAIDELTTAEIATLLNRTEAAIRGLLFRARNHLRQRLASTTATPITREEK